ncbi:MAG: hypothetical protein JW958_07140 [Candidatus Eisenbacteria bacterium]|nr:hypothetical protein [Candidatus Eisenbacteria bacterium]
MTRKGTKEKRRRLHTPRLSVPPAKRFLPALLAAVILLVACVSQRFSVVQMHQENMELRAELEKHRGAREREEANVAALLARGRIERLARERLELRPPEQGEQVFLVEWTAPIQGGGGEGLFGGAGRGLVELIGLARGDAVDGRGTGGGR